MPRLNRNEALRQLADVAREAVEGVAMANYRWREDEAYKRIDAALARLLRNNTKDEENVGTSAAGSASGVR